MKQYHIKWDNKYVKECEYEYLVECSKEESVFNEDYALAIQRECPFRIKLEEMEE